MKIVTTNLLNRFWKSGVKPIKEALTGKVDSSKIVNSLLATEAGFALDARQGKVLDDKVTELIGKLDTLPAGLTEWDVLGTYINDGLKSCKPMSDHSVIVISLFDNVNNASHGFNMVPLELFKLYNSHQHALGISAYNNGRIFCYVNYVNNTAVNIQVSSGYGVCLYGF